MATWDKKVDLKDVFHADMPLVEKRDIIVKRLAKAFGDDTWEVDELATVETVEEFDEVWDEIYDLADFRRIWIATV